MFSRPENIVEGDIVGGGPRLSRGYTGGGGGGIGVQHALPTMQTSRTGASNPSSGLPLSQVYLTDAQRGLQQKLEKEMVKIAAASAVQAITVSFPLASLLYTAYLVAKFAYPIIKTGIKTYLKTGDTDAAFMSMAGQAIRQCIGLLVGTVVDYVTGSTVDYVQAATNIKIGNTAYVAAKEAASDVVEDTIDYVWDKERSNIIGFFIPYTAQYI